MEGIGGKNIQKKLITLTSIPETGLIAIDDDHKDLAYEFHRSHTLQFEKLKYYFDYYFSILKLDIPVVIESQKSQVEPKQIQLTMAVNQNELTFNIVYRIYANIETQKHLVDLAFILFNIKMNQNNFGLILDEQSVSDLSFSVFRTQALIIAHRNKLLTDSIRYAIYSHTSAVHVTKILSILESAGLLACDKKEDYIHDVLHTKSLIHIIQALTKLPKNKALTKAQFESIMGYQCLSNILYIHPSKSCAIAAQSLFKAKKSDYKPNLIIEKSQKDDTLEPI